MRSKRREESAEDKATREEEIARKMMGEDIYRSVLFRRDSIRAYTSVFEELIGPIGFGVVSCFEICRMQKCGFSRNQVVGLDGLRFSRMWIPFMFRGHSHPP